MWPLKGGYPVPKKGGQAAVQAKARSLDRAPNTWRTRIFTAVRQKSEAQETDADPKLYTFYSRAVHKNTQQPARQNLCV